MSFPELHIKFQMFLRIFFLIILIAGGIFCFTFSKNNDYTEIIPVSKDNIIVPERPSGEYELRQDFITPKDYFAGVELLAATFQKRRLSGKGEAKLLDDAGHLCGTYIFSLRKIKDNNPFSISFPVQEKAAGKKWTLVLRLSQCAFYYSDGRADSALYLNGKKMPVMLKMREKYWTPEGYTSTLAKVTDFRFGAGVFLIAAAFGVVFYRKKNLPLAVRFMSEVVLPFIIVLLAFCLLYRSYIFDSHVYIFYDIGCDTNDQFIPALKNFLEHPFGSVFSMTQALGMSGYTFNFIRFDPFNYLLFLFPSSELAPGLLYILFLKYELIALVSYQYFHLVFINRKLALTGCLLWTFTQFNLLWGQHYHFLTVIVFVTVLVFCMEMILRGKKLFVICFSLAAAWLSCFFFYFFYMFCIFAVLYLVIRSFLKKDSFQSFFLQGCTIGGCLLLSMLMGLFQIVPWLQSFFCSSRSQMSCSLAELFTVQLPYAGTVAGRILCPSFFRATRIYLDYYTAPNIFLSVFVIYAVSGLLFIRSDLKIWCIAATALFCTLFPLFSFLTTMSPLQSRWIFMLHFLVIIGVLCFLQRLPLFSKNEKEKLILFSTVFFLLLLIAGMLEFIRGWHTALEDIPIKKFLSPVIFSAVFFLLYGGLLGLAAKKQVFVPIFILIFICELLFGYEKIVHRRHTLIKQKTTYSIITGKRFSDLQKLKRNSVYGRTNFSIKYSEPIMAANFPMLFSMPGSSVYNSIRPAALDTFAPEYVWSINPNVFDLHDSFLANRLLGIKYKITNHDGIPSFYNNGRTGSGDWKLYEYPECRFGYVLPSEAECTAPAENMPCQDRFLLMYSHWWKSRDKNTSREQFAADGPFYRFLHSTEVPAGFYRPLSIDRSLCPELSLPIGKPVPIEHPLKVNLPRQASEKGVYLLLADMECSTCSCLTLSDRFARKSFPVFPGRHKYVFYLPFRNISDFCIAGNSTTLYDMELIYVPDFTERIKKLSETINVSAVRNEKISSNTWSAEVENLSGANAVLCVPFSFIPGWTAEVNGKKVPVKNINNGLLGIRLAEKGINQVVLTWCPPGQMTIRLISFAAFALFICLSVFLKRRGGQKSAWKFF